MLINKEFYRHVFSMRKVCVLPPSGGWVKAALARPQGLALTRAQRPTLWPMGGFGAAKATRKPPGGEWLPRQGNGKG